MHKKLPVKSLSFFNLRKLYYKILDTINDSGTDLVQNFTGFGLYDKVVVEKFREINDPYPYLRGLICELGYQRALVEFEQPLRKRGITKNNFYTLYDNAMIGFTNHSKVPLRMMAFLGFILSAISFILGLVYLIIKLIWWYKFPAGTAPILIGLFLWVLFNSFSWSGRVYRNDPYSGYEASACR